MDEIFFIHVNICTVKSKLLILKIAFLDTHNLSYYSTHFMP